MKSVRLPATLVCVFPGEPAQRLWVTKNFDCSGVSPASKLLPAMTLREAGRSRVPRRRARPAAKLRDGRVRFIFAKPFGFA